jgi:predicted RNA-binding Zn-ribbon protein involved in translation (DUF1610 family)
MDHLSKNRIPSTHSPSATDCPECSRPMSLKCSLPGRRGELFVCPSCGRVKTRMDDYADPGASLRVA